ncbi:MAG: DUF2334 domain-containing protein [Acidobacteriia bacterium]|nr:DUF2334 domain-containing protein [Terriglobia bacterium]
MRFAIRDDDASYFTRPEQLDQVWSRILPYAPVSLAVTPFAVEAFHLGDPERFHQGNQAQALNKNSDLVDWMRQRLVRGSISVMCHGHTHEYKRVAQDRLLAEYVWKPSARLALETRESKRHLENTLRVEVSTFVPPGNSISRAGLVAVGPYFPNVLATLSLRRWRDLRMEWSCLSGYARRLYCQLRYGAPALDGGRVAGVQLFPSFSLTAQTSWSALVQRFELCHDLEADFIVAVHYWEVRGGVRDMLGRLLELASRRGCEFAHCQDLFRPLPAPGLELSRAGV